MIELWQTKNGKGKGFGVFKKEGFFFGVGGGKKKKLMK